MDVSVLTGATDANPVNKLVQLLSDLETKIQVAWRPNNLTSVLWCELQTSNLAKDRADLVAQIDATSEALRTKVDDLARCGDPMPVRWRQAPSASTTTTSRVLTLKVESTSAMVTLTLALVIRISRSGGETEVVVLLTHSVSTHLERN